MPLRLEQQTRSSLVRMPRHARNIAKIPTCGGGGFRSIVVDPAEQRRPCLAGIFQPDAATISPTAHQDTIRHGRHLDTVAAARLLTRGTLDPSQTIGVNLNYVRPSSTYHVHPDRRGRKNVLRLHRATVVSRTAQRPVDSAESQCNLSKLIAASVTRTALLTKTGHRRPAHADMGTIPSAFIVVAEESGRRPEDPFYTGQKGFDLAARRVIPPAHTGRPKPGPR